MNRARTGNEIGAVASLAEPVRRRLYDYVSNAHQAVGRDEAAAALGIGRPLAAFHLDRLVRGGLLTVEYRRLTGRSGPGSGRPAKLYRRTPVDVTVSLPPREYELAAEVFASALEGLSSTEPPPALTASARAQGERIGREALESGRGPEAQYGGGEAEAEAPDQILLRVLTNLGFEPDSDGTLVRLRNCPFDALARAHRGVTCPSNLGMLEGIREAVGASAVVRPLGEPGFCCVALVLQEQSDGDPAGGATG